MLEVLARCPVTAPLEAGISEETEAEVVVGDLIGEVPCAVAVGLGSGGLNEAGAIGTILVIGVIECVDINGQATGMLRELDCTSDGTITEARRVVVTHLCFVVGIIHVG